MVSAKLNKGSKNNFIIAVANAIKKVDKKTKVNQLKKDLRFEIEGIRSLNKTSVKKLTKVIPKEHKELFEQKVSEYNNILDQRPKRLMTAYMTYSQKQLNKHKALTFAERGKAISKSWKTLSVKQKARYNPTASAKTQYQKQLQSFNDKIKGFKTA